LFDHLDFSLSPLQLGLPQFLLDLVLVILNGASHVRGILWSLGLERGQAAGGQLDQCAVRAAGV
jgi:hypothetical protein